ncbi:peptidoglycan-binding domain-containing protein [Microbacterium sp. 22215]|uniref:peptidoglycan-binding domain-containing protein n=1 Tax=Microbacterium sp. 22215 TaxID=3453893 RepID=UPI003F865D90
MGPSNSGVPRIPVPSTSNSGVSNCTLNQGTVNDAVRGMQQALNQCYGKGLTVDGNFGPATRTALRSVQSAIGATSDGIFGPSTRDRMTFKGNGSTCQTGLYIRTNHIAYFN